MNEIVQYDNFMNELKFKGFGVTDYNMLLALCSEHRRQGINEISFSFAKLKELTNYKQTSKSVFMDDLKKMNNRLMKITCNIRTEDELIMFVLFPTFKINLEKETLTAAVNPEFAFILNEIAKNFTWFDLREFVLLDSKYTKTLYRLLKQFKATGYYKIDIKSLRELLDVPKSCPNKDLLSKIIKPCVEELKMAFKGLRVNTVNSKTRGNPISHYEFVFEPEGYVKPLAGKKTSGKKNVKSNQFNNFDQRDYGDMSELERKLLGYEVPGQIELADVLVDEE